MKKSINAAKTAKKATVKSLEIGGWFYDKKGNVHKVLSIGKPVTQFGKIPDSVGFSKLG